MEDTSPLQKWLQTFVGKHGAVAGTVHARTSPDSLTLAASVNIPEPVLRVTAQIPRGKGMAGLAFERAEPVHTCNLKTDTSGDVRPGARAVDAQAAVALPVFDTSGGVRGVVGIAFAAQRDLPDDELAALSSEANQVPI